MRPSLLLPAIALIGIPVSALAQMITCSTTVLPPGPGPQPINAPNNGGLIEIIDAYPITVSATPPGTDVCIASIRVDSDPTIPTAVRIPFAVNLTITPEAGVPYIRSLDAVLEGTMAPGQAQVRVRWVIEMPVTMGSGETKFSVWPVPSSPPMPFIDDRTQPGVQPDPSAPLGLLSVHIVAGGTAYPSVTGLSLLPTAVGVGAYSMATVQTSAPVPIDGLVVDITSSDQTMVGTPQKILIPAGAMAATFPVAGRHVTPEASVTVSAPGSARSASIRVSPTLPCGLKGDMNGDGSLTVEDAIALLKAIAGL